MRNALAALGLAIAAVTACGGGGAGAGAGGSACQPNDRQDCTYSSCYIGTRICLEDGSWSACTCTGNDAVSAPSADVGVGPGAGSGGGMGHGFTGAMLITLDGAPTPGSLLDVDTPDFYKFYGKKGARISASVSAQALAGTNGFDRSVLDPVVTLYDAHGNQIAQDDDVWPPVSLDAQAFTVLPADGVYYVSVNDCIGAFPDSKVCASGDNISDLDYQLTIASVSHLDVPEVGEGAEPNGTAQTAAQIPYKLSMSKGQQYGYYLINGDFADRKDADVFSFQPPVDIAFPAGGRPQAGFWVQPITAFNGTGAKANARIWIVDGASMKTIAAVDQVDHGDGDNLVSGPIALTVPVAPKGQYYLFVKHGTEPSFPEGDFYFIWHRADGVDVGQREGAPDNDDTPAKAQPLSTPEGDAADYFVDGDITGAGGPSPDVDYYSAAVPYAPAEVAFGCAARRAGSGLRGAKFSLLAGDGTPIGSLTELANRDAHTDWLKVPPGAKKVLLKVEAGSQDPLVAGTYYHCWIGFGP
jgi:hypothetical protein